MSSHEEIMAPSVLFIGNKKENINIKRSKEQIVWVVDGKNKKIFINVKH